MFDVVIRNGKVFRNHRFETVQLGIHEGKIVKVATETEHLEGLQIYDAKGKFVVPGFIDVHTHGAVNIDVNAACADELETIGTYFATQGTTSWLCSILTDTKEQTLWCIEQFLEYKKTQRVGAELMGIHLEGPFLAREYKGAMPEHLLRTVDIELLKQYQEAAQGNIRYITVSPEVEGVEDNIKAMTELGMVVAIGHSGATYDVAMNCIEQGATAATHTFNAMRLMHQHEPAIAGAVLESDVYCEAICDGRHLHPGVVRLLMKTKGLDRVVGITDCIMATGLPDGNYKLGVNDIVVVDGDAKLANGSTRAGSTLTTRRAFQNAMTFSNKSMEDILGIFTENPAKMLGIYHQRGSLDLDKLADILIIDENHEIIDTFVKGQLTPR